MFNKKWQSSDAMKNARGLMVLGYYNISGFSLILFISLFISFAFAEDSELSPAMTEALALQEQAGKEQIEKQIALCNHSLLSAPEDLRQILLEKLGNKTCRESVLESIAE